MNGRFEKISVIGLGYVGLPTAATIAARGVRVHGVDIRAEVVERINHGKTHIIEPDLDIVVHSVVSMGMLKASTTPEPADAFVIAVPTPVFENNQPDMRAVEGAVAAIAPVLAPGNLVIIESTSPVGTTRKAAEQLRALRPDLSFPDQNPERADILMAYCPERILPGNTLRELTDNARLVGGLDRRSADRAHDFYSIFVKGQIHKTEAPVAEMAKVTENAFRDVNIAFANELSVICDASGIDVWQVIKLANLHPRVNILAPGPGVGGHCIPVDPWFIVHAQPELARLIRTAREVNLAKQTSVTQRIKRAADKFREPRIALLGMTYKPNVDDMRESPAVAIAEELASGNTGEIFIVEPHVNKPPRELANASRVHWAGLADALRDADIVVVLVAHDQFRDLRRATLSEKIVIDTVGLIQ
jgi:UDP-N-acetyl-D-mannosaminuronic acid dehydrogenase